MENPTAQDQLSPDALAATLAHATNMHEMSLPQAPEGEAVDASVAPQDALGEEMAPEAPKDELKPEETGLAKLEGKFEQGIKDLGDTIRAGFDKLGKNDGGQA